MSALAAAHDVELGGRELALLCQKAEVCLHVSCIYIALAFV
jgi:hypothetical protein